MTDQFEFDIFGSKADRDEAMEKLRKSNPQFMRDGLYQIGKFTTDPEWIGRKLIFEDLTKALSDLGIVPQTGPNAWGTLAMDAAQKGLLKKVKGEQKAMAKRGSHRRQSFVYIIADNRVKDPLPEAPPPKTNAYYDQEGRFVHDVCAITGCKNSPSFGVGVSLLKGRLGMWYCAEHRP